MRTIEEALAPYGSQQRPALPHDHCVDEDAVENGLLAVEQAFASYGIPRLSRADIYMTVREEFWDGVKEWKNS